MRWHEKQEIRHSVNALGSSATIQITDEVKTIVPKHNCIQLNQIPDEINRLEIYRGRLKMKEVYNENELDTQSYRVDYVNGMVFFSPIIAGQEVRVSYYGKGVNYIHISRVILDDGTLLGDALASIMEMMNRQQVSLLHNTMAEPEVSDNAKVAELEKQIKLLQEQNKLLLNAIIELQGGGE